MSKRKAYLGDSVYVDIWGSGVVLTTENAPGIPSNEIYMEPEVLVALVEYVERLKKEAAAAREASDV